MYLRGRINRQMHALAQRTDRAYVIRMIVRHEDAHDIRKIQTHLAQTLLYLARRDAGVNEDSLLTRAEVIAVSATTTGEAPEYEFVFFHNTYLRVPEPLVVVEVRVALEPEEVLEEDEPDDVRVEVDAGAAVRALLMDSRLTVVVRPVSSVVRTIVRVVPDLLTRLSTEVEG